jgi:hypothetical protein
VAVAAVPLKVTVLVSGVVPKFAPVIVTDEPIAPDADDRLVMLGVVANKAPENTTHKETRITSCRIILAMIASSL